MAFKMFKRSVHRLTYRAQVTSPTAERVWIVVPLPLETPWQQVLEKISFTPAITHIGRDARFDNPYAMWETKMLADTPMAFHYTTIVRVEARTRPTAPQPTPRLGSLCHFDESVDEEKSPSDVRREDLSLRQTPFEMTNAINGGALNFRWDKLAKKIRGTETDTFKILHRINRYVIAHLTYGDPIPGLYSAEDALTKPRVDCGGFDSLFIALCLALGIPARLISGFWKEGSMHAWLEAQLEDGTWIPADPSVEQLFALKRTRRSGRLGFVDNDRIAFSLGSLIPIEINGQHLTVPLLQHPFVYAPDTQTVLYAEAHVATV